MIKSHTSCEVDGSTGTNTLSVVSALQHTMDTTDGELDDVNTNQEQTLERTNLETSTRRTRGTFGICTASRGLSTRLSSDFAAFSFARHILTSCCF